jgi:hypothetical protein
VTSRAGENEMTDITPTATDLEIVTIIINAALLLGMGLAMIFAKRLENFGAKLLEMKTPSLFRHADTSGFSAFSLRGNS